MSIKNIYDDADTIDKIVDYANSRVWILDKSIPEFLDEEKDLIKEVSMSLDTIKGIIKNWPSTKRANSEQR